MKGLLFKGGAYLTFWPRGWKLIWERVLIGALTLIPGNMELVKKYIRYFLPLEIKYCEGMLKSLKKKTSPLKIECIFL